MHNTHRRRIVAQGFSGMRRRVQHDVFWCACGDHFAAGVATFGAEVNQPVAGADHVEVVLDHDQRIPRIKQLAHGAHQLGDVIEMQTGGGFVEHEQGTAPRQRLAAGAGIPGGLGQKARELEALRLAARERRHRLPQLDVFESDIDDRLQRANDFAVSGEKGAGLADGEVQHVGNVELLCLALDRNFKNLGAVTLAIAVGAAQIDVAQELHLDVLETRATASGASAIAIVETELGRGVAALARERCVGKNLADCIPCANIAGRIRARRLADRRLVHKYHVAELLGAQQLLMQPRRVGGFAKVAQQRRRQHVLDQGRFAGTADTGDANQTLQRELDADVLQIVLTHALQQQTRRAGFHQPLEAHADLLAPTQVSAGERIGITQFSGGAIKHDLPTALARTWPHVDHPIRCQHHGRVVLHHHQRVAGVAQALHGKDDAVHVARMQANAGLVQNEQGVDQ